MISIDLNSAAKDVWKLIKNHQDSELLNKYRDLQVAISEYLHKMEDLERENRRLRDEIENRARLTYDQSHRWYKAKDDQVPYCPRCWEADKKAIHLNVFAQGSFCPVCNWRTKQVFK